MSVWVNQPFFYGDIIFSQTIVRLINNGGTISWPIKDEWVDDFSRAYPDIEWYKLSKGHIDIERRDRYVKDGDEVMPIRWACELLGNPYTKCMSSKYALYGIDYKLWDYAAMWNRDRVKERELMETIGFSKGDNIINEHFSSGRARIPVNGHKMSRIDGFSLFDWAGVLEQSGEIHTVSTSLFYVIKLLGLMDKTKIYPRLPLEKDLSNIAELLD